MQLRIITLLIAILLCTRAATAQPPAKPLDPDVAALVKGNNEFAFDLYHQLRHQKGNLFFSPYSISTMLAMAYAGAKGETAEQMAKTLHFPLNQEKLHLAFGKLMCEMPDQVNVANGLWRQQGFPLRDSFIKTARQSYRTELGEVDFSNGSARDTINRWVEKNTRGKIRDLVSPADAGAGTRLVLANAIHFKDDWKTVFPQKDTKDADFLVEPGKKVNVPMMQIRKHYFNGSWTENFILLELPYANDRLAMAIVLPVGKGGLPEMEKSLSAKQIDVALKRLTLWRISSFLLPRFKMQSTFGLRETLAGMGMLGAFRSDADFSGIGNAAPPLRSVVHKARIDVNELGTEAAAATAGGWALSGGLAFSADHPFFFFIYDQRTRAILFMGRVTDPSAPIE